MPLHPIDRSQRRPTPLQRSSGLGWVLLLGGSLAPRAVAAEPPNPYRLLDELAETLSTVENEYFEPTDGDRLLDSALRGLVAGLDPHSVYFSQQDLEIFEGDTSGRFGGVGVEVDFNAGQIVVIAPIDGSPAARAGLESGDVIVAIDGLAVQDKKPDELVRHMRGPVGSKVRLTVQKKNSGQMLELWLVREQIKVSSVRAQRLAGDVAYLRIKSFQDGTHAEMLQAWTELVRSGPLSGALLDLRNNPGGLVKEAVAVADEFLSSGLIYSTKHRGETQRSAEAHGGGAFTSGPLVVLVNEYSASAAELVAGALKDQRRAVLVGARTFGKGSVQTVLPLARGAALKLTTALYYTPSGKTLQARGVEPDLVVLPESSKVAPLAVLRESDLDGHIAAEPSAGVARNAEATRIPTTDDELHLGVARVIPLDPSTSRDSALRAAYEIVRGIRVAR